MWIGLNQEILSQMFHREEEEWSFWAEYNITLEYAILLFSRQILHVFVLKSPFRMLSG